MQGLIRYYSVNHVARPLLPNIRTKMLLVVEDKAPWIQGKRTQTKTFLVVEVKVLRIQGKLTRFVPFC